MGRNAAAVGRNAVPVGRFAAADEEMQLLILSRVQMYLYSIEDINGCTGIFGNCTNIC